MDRAEMEELAANYVPELILHNEIAQRRRKVAVIDDENPVHELIGDYYPRDISYVLKDAKMTRRGNLFTGFRARTVRVPTKQQSHRMRPRAVDQLAVTTLKSNDMKTLYMDVFVGARQISRKAYWKRYYNTIVASGNQDRYPVTAYTNVIDGSTVTSKRSAMYRDLVVIQYWLFYPYNDWHNTHEGDWEHVDVILRRTSDGLRPIACACSAHHGGSYLPWNEVDRVDDDRKMSPSGNHPVAHVAIGSHANYFLGGRAIEVNSFPRLTDRTVARQDDSLPTRPANECRPVVRLVDADDLGTDPLFRFTGHWGSRGLAGAIPVVRFLPVIGKIVAGPLAPWSRRAWTDPFEWLEGCHEPHMWLPRMTRASNQ